MRPRDARARDVRSMVAAVPARTRCRRHTARALLRHRRDVSMAAERAVTTTPASWPARTLSRLRHIDLASLLMVAVSLLGLALRVEHAITFDGLGRGSDYETHMAGVRWMLQHGRPFSFSPDLGRYNWSIGYQPPLWYALGAAILKWTHTERAIAFVAVAGWTVRQVLLASFLKATLPRARWNILAALTINAVLPISVLTDGKVNPEGLHSTLFTVSLYVLWRMERQALRRPAGITLGSAVAFGGFAGLAVLTKATASVLPITAAVVLLWRAPRAIKQDGWKTTWRQVGRPALLAALAWCLVAGWWCGPNLVKYGHPFPHTWDRESTSTQPILAQPPLYRRPLGWALPFYWAEYLRTPIIRSTEVPRPNLWAVLVSGTWSDFYNRGFCRLKGGGDDHGFWGGWPVSGRCLNLFSALASVGCFITLFAASAVLRTGWRHIRSGGREGTLALPAGIVLAVLFASLFALVYPYDYAAVLNPRYLLPGSTAISACLGLGLERLESDGWKAKLARRMVLVAIGIVAVLVVYERWGS